MVIDFERLLINVIEILQMMVSANTEIYRVEESASKMLSAYGAKKVDVFATTTNIIISIITDDGRALTHTRRIDEISTDLEKIHLLNSLVRKISTGKVTIEEIETSIKNIKNTKSYPTYVICLISGLIAASFCLFFGGDFIQTAVSFIIGFINGVILWLLKQKSIKKILRTFIASFFAAIVALVLQKIGIVTSADSIIVGNIMTLIPGIGLVDSIRDLLLGDSISGILRFIEAVILAAAIAVGYIAAVLILRVIMI